MKKYRRCWVSIPLVLSGIALSSVTNAVEAQQGRSDVRIRTARFWRGEGRTLLEGVVGLPAARSTRGVELSVRDSTGRVLHVEAWTDSVSPNAAALVAANAELTTKFEVVLRPALYIVGARSTEGTSTDSTRVEVRAFKAAPLISDVVVSARMRVLAENEEPTSAEIKRGRYAIERGTRVTVLPTEPSLWYYLELYRQGADSVAQLEFRVVPLTGESPLVRVQRNVLVGKEGTVDAARLVVQGLPPGDYRLLTSATVGNRVEHRTAAFTMGSFETVPVAPAPVAASGSEGTLYDRYFAPGVRSDAEVNDLVEALTVAAPASAVPSETGLLPEDAKRRFLARYFSRTADPNPATAGHELVEEFMQRVRHVSAQYTEQRGQSGIKTDRGRIYLKYGPPDASQIAPMMGKKAVEIWKYTRRRSIKFAFLDETGFGNYNMIYTTDPNEQTLPDWQERVEDVETIRLILSF